MTAVNVLSSGTWGNQNGISGLFIVVVLIGICLPWLGVDVPTGSPGWNAPLLSTSSSSLRSSVCSMGGSVSLKPCRRAIFYLLYLTFFLSDLYDASSERNFHTVIRKENIQRSQGGQGQALAHFQSNKASPTRRPPSKWSRQRVFTKLGTWRIL